MPKRKKEAPPRRRAAVTKPTNIKFLSTQHQALEALQEARRCTDGEKPTMSRLVQEALKQYIPTMDLATGYPRPRDSVRITAWTAVIPAGLHYFHEIHDCNRFADDAALCHAIDQTCLMAWAGAPDQQCLRVSPSLMTYTGVPLSGFLDSAWPEIVHVEDRPNVLAHCAVSWKARQPFANLYRIRKRDHTWGWAYDSAAPRYHLNGEFAGFVGTIAEVAVYAPGTLLRNLTLTGSDSWAVQKAAATGQAA